MTIMTLERRDFNVSEYRAVRSSLRITGHAAVFNRLSGDLGGFREQVEPGFFRQTILEDDIRALFNHDPNHILGRNKAETLVLGEDPIGLDMQIMLPDNSLGNNLLTSIERGDITGASFGFETLEDRWERIDGMDVRTLVRGRLFDVGPVTFPAYVAAHVEVAKRAYAPGSSSRAATPAYGGRGSSSPSWKRPRRRR